MSIDTTSDILSGYAWSDNIGWISANNVGTPSGGALPLPPPIGSGIEGWLRALSADNNDWDGYIYLAQYGGSNPYGPVVDAHGNITGYSWGSENIGWLDWQAKLGEGACSSTPDSCTLPDGTGTGQTITQTNPDCTTQQITTCAAPQFCSPGSSVCLNPTGTLQLTAAPTVVGAGEPTTLTWTASDVSSCQDIKGTDGEDIPVVVVGNSANGSQQSLPISQVTTFTLNCLGEDGTPYTASKTVSLAPVYNEQ